MNDEIPNPKETSIHTPVERITPKKPVAPEPVAPMTISGLFQVVFTITDTNCPFQGNLIGQTPTRDLELSSRGDGLLLPLPSLSSIFQGPVMLRIVGSGLTYRGPVQVKDVPMGPSVTGEFDGAFRPDGGQFNVRFELSSICTIGGTITGTRH